MGIKIEKISKHNIKDIYKLNDYFTIDSTLVLSLEENEIKYEIKSIPAFEKRYPDEEDDIDFNEYINNENKIIYLAFIDEQYGGRIILRKNWNQYAYIEDITVDKNYRGKGIGRKLIESAKTWAVQNNMPGIMLETQNNNVRACKLYERCGFKIAGFDLNLYKGFNKDTKEFAIYWYLTI